MDLRVVLCDDVADMRELMRIALEGDDGVEIVGEAENGRDAARVVAELQPDAVVLDLSMPELDGLEAIRLISQSSPSTAIVVFSGFSADRMLSVAIEEGADRYLEKGSRLSALPGLLREAVQERRERGLRPLPEAASESRHAAWYRSRRRS